MLILGIEFLTGSAVMTDATTREQAEWPPHPARVFMALVAAHYENVPLTSDTAANHEAWKHGRAALEWLENAGVPSMRWPEAQRRDLVKVYVPVNDASVPGKPAGVKGEDLRGAMDVLPDRRSRQERTFPSVHIGMGIENAAYLYWDKDPPYDIVTALRRLAAQVTRVGHSSSLTRIWVAVESEAPPASHRPSSQNAGTRGISLRIPMPGLLAELDQRFNAENIEAFYGICEVMAAGSAGEKKKAKEAYVELFGQEWSASSKSNPPVRRWPGVGITAAYVPVGTAVAQPQRSPYDSELIVLTKQEGPVLGLEATTMLTSAMRGFLLEGSEGKAEWFTGHKSAGVPADGPHLAILPLAYVGSEYADGHVLGLALAIPTSVSPESRAAGLASRLMDDNGDDREIVLTLGKAGKWTLVRESRSRPAISLRSGTWTEPSSVWASVTPVVLDRHPKSDPSDPKQRAAWRDEVAAIVAESCLRTGLPRPSAIDIDKTSWHRGAPRSKPGPGGMPLLACKPGSAPRQQIHVLLQFDDELQGPVFLGAGRYRGYGLCKPLGPASK